MKAKIIMLLLVITIALASCTDHGKRVKINDNTEVYVKGEGVTEADGKKLGDFFVETFKDSKNAKSFQLTKDSGQYVVRMVVDQEKVKDNTLDVSFMAIQFLVESQVFTGNKVKFILTDNTFKDIKVFPSTSASK